MISRSTVLHVAAFTNPIGGGFVAALAHLSQRLEAFETALLCPRSCSEYAWSSLLASRGVRMLYADSPLDVATAVARARPAIVHTHFVDWAFSATLGATAIRARVAWHLHSGTTNAGGLRNLARHAKYVAARRLVECFFCVSPDISAYLVEHGIKPSQLVELPNGIELGRFHLPSDSERTSARKSLGLPDERPALAFFGRDASVKGADRLARSLELLRARSPATSPVVLAVASSRETVRLLERHATVVDCGQIGDVRQAFWACDAMAAPSRTEGVPYALLEARACGLPAVASTLPGIARVLGGDCGTKLVDADNAASLADTLSDALVQKRVPLEPEISRTISLDTWADRLAQWYKQADLAGIGK